MYIRPKGVPYYRFLSRLHERTLFDWYLEVGCRQGKSFAPVRSKTIAVDPFFRAEINIIGKKPALHVFQTTSDAFLTVVSWRGTKSGSAPRSWTGCICSNTCCAISCTLNRAGFAGG